MKPMVNYQLKYFASSTLQSTQSEIDIFNWCSVTYSNASETATNILPVSVHMPEYSITVIQLVIFLTFPLSTTDNSNMTTS